MWEEADSTNGALEDPPAGVESNFEYPYMRLDVFYTTSVLALTFTTIAVAIRFFAKVHLFKHIHPEDYLIIAGYATLVPAISLLLLYGLNGGGRHSWDIPVEETYPYFHLYKIEYAMDITTFVSNIPAKLAVLVQLRRIFFPHNLGSRILYHATTVIMIVHTLGTTTGAFIIAFACKPVEYVWRSDIEGKCLDDLAALIAFNSIHVLVDITALIIPLVGIKRLHMARRRKWTAYSLFAVAAFAGVASIARLITVVEWWMIEERPYDDFVRESQLTCWAIAEVSAALIVACFPSMPRFFDYLASKIRQAKQPRHDHERPNAIAAERVRLNISGSLDESWGSLTRTNMEIPPSLGDNRTGEARPLHSEPVERVEIMATKSQ